MYSNNTCCDIYIGTGAGKKLLDEITQASKSIKIVSPFVSSQLAGRLIVLHQKGVSVELITCENDTPNELLQTLIQQEVQIDERARTRRHRLKVGRWLCYGLLGVALIITSWFLFSRQISAIILGVALILCVWLILAILNYSFRNIRIKTYTYTSLFPIRMIKFQDGFGKRATYLHSKIYIIDQRIAYLGSLNFTRGGTQSNYETRIRITDPATITKILEEFNFLWEDQSLPQVDIASWGSKLYPEPAY